MFRLKVAALALLASCAVGCISLDSVIKVKADGTGTIEQTLLVNSSAMGMLSMMGNEKGGGSAPDPSQLFTEDKLKSDAAKLGEGVTFVSSTPVTQGELKGVKAVYAFTDFNKLRVTTALPDVDNGSGAMSGKGEPLPLVFTRNGSSSLISLDMLAGMKNKEKPTGITKSDEAMPMEMLGMFAPMFKDMRVAVAIEPVGTLVRTNANHVQGKRVTLFDVAFGELMADPANLQKLQALGDSPSLDEIQSTLKGVKGLKVNDAQKLEIEFR